MTIAIIGSGNMATGIGTRLVSGKHEITIYDRKPEKAKELAEKLGGDVKGEELGENLEGDVVIFTLPYNAIFEIIEKYKEKLADKILVDISNPVDFQTFKLIPDPTTSGAQEIAKHLPTGAKIIKAFNTTFAGTLIKGEVAGEKLDVFIASDNEEAKKTISELVESSGMRPLDAGPLSNAHALEEFALLHMQMQDKLGNTWMSAIKILQ